eukprot:c2302_g1_i1.p1 GENE.c2302_g1_i1~~c2302_g1_i1.p1  ORF type:complete len:264 (-),score=83.00 c2302_g1_i1:35-826(-)
MGSSSITTSPSPSTTTSSSPSSSSSTSSSPSTTITVTVTPSTTPAPSTTASATISPSTTASPSSTITEMVNPSVTPTSTLFESPANIPSPFPFESPSSSPTVSALVCADRQSHVSVSCEMIDQSMCGVQLTESETVANVCPMSCGCCESEFEGECECDKDSQVSRITSKYGFGWIRSCQQVVHFVSCDNRFFGDLLHKHCPCTCLKQQRQQNDKDQEILLLQQQNAKLWKRIKQQHKLLNEKQQIIDLLTSQCPQSNNKGYSL